MSESSLGSNLGFEDLAKERDLLQGKLGELSAERDTCLNVEGPNLQSLYYQKIGHLEVACLSAEMECARLKREIELITAATNRGSSWDYEEITKKLDEEFAEWQAKITKEFKALDEAKERLANLMPPADAKKFRDLYRSLVKELHPDVHPDRHPRLRPLWDRVQRAYLASDLEEMELIRILLADESTDTSPVSIDILRSEVRRLKLKCQTLIDELFTIREKFPFTLAALLSDPVQMTEKHKLAEEKLHLLGKKRDGLKTHLSVLLDGTA